MAGIIMHLSSCPQKERHRILREEFGVKFGDEDKLYIGMLERGATSPAKSVPLEKSALVRRGLRMGHLGKGKGGFYLAETGQMIARGAKRIFN